MKAQATTEPSPTAQLDDLIDTLNERDTHPLLQQFQARQSQRWSYAQIADQTLALARGLQKRVEPGEAVALLGPEGPDWITAALAILRSGAVVMPLDVQLSDEHLKHILQDSGARWIFTTRHHHERIKQAAPQLQQVGLLQDEDLSPHWRELDAAEARLPDHRPDDPAALFYTSGTTGPPKGVPLSHGNLGFQLDTVAAAGMVHAGDRVLLPLPLHHVYPFVIGLLASLSLGLTLVLPHALTGPQIVRAVRQGQVSVIIGVPRLYQALVDGVDARAGGAGRLAHGLFRGLLQLSLAVRRRLGWQWGKALLYPLHRQVGPQLRVLACGGAALDPELAWRLGALGWQVAVGYGLTETAPLLTIDPPGETRPGTVGRAVPGVELRIDRQAAPRGEAETHEAGEIQARGPNVFRGYHHLEQETRESFTEDGWFRTGDLGWLDPEGYLHISGRVSTLIVTAGGKNIQPDELEARYSAAAAIQEIGVLQQDDRLVALVVPANQDDEDPATAIGEAIDSVAEQLPSYQRLNDFALTHKPLPRTRLGKIRRHQLAQRYQQARGGDEDAQQAPLDPQEWSAEDRNLLEHTAVRHTWQLLTQHYAQRALTPDTRMDRELGVDSLGWLNLTMEIGEQTGVELDDEAIGRIRRVRDLLQEVIEADRAQPGGDPLADPEQTLRPRQRRWLQARPPPMRAAAGALYGLNRWLMQSLFRLRMEGREQVPEQGPVILACNHASYLDPFAVAAALPTARLQTLYWGGWTGVAFNNRLKLWGSRAVQIIPIDPEQGVRSSLALAAAVLKQRRGLIWFPEGERSQSGALQDFRRGIGMLLSHYPVPVVPVYILGSHAALPPQRRLPRLRPIHVQFEAPLDPQQLARQGEGEDPAERMVAALHAHMARRLDELQAGDGEAA